MSLEHAVANVLKKLAVYVEATESEKKAAVQAARKKLLGEVNEKFAAVTGEKLSEDTLGKLADADPEVLATLTKIAEDPVGTDLGAPSDRKTAGAPLSKDEAVEAAGDNLISFCTS